MKTKPPLQQWMTQTPERQTWDRRPFWRQQPPSNWSCFQELAATGLAFYSNTEIAVGILGIINPIKGFWERKSREVVLTVLIIRVNAAKLSLRNLECWPFLFFISFPHFSRWFSLTRRYEGSPISTGKWRKHMCFLAWYILSLPRIPSPRCSL